MPAYIALLRGINVGGRQKLAMADLRALLASLGYEAVSTHLQSGNAVFATARDDADGLAGEIEAGIARDLGLDVRVLLRTRDELAAVVAANPFPQAAADPARLLVTVLSAQPAADRFASIDPARFAPDEFRLGDRVIYAWYPNGIGRSKLTNDVWERRLAVTGTARNWNTVRRLAELAG